MSEFTRSLELRVNTPVEKVDTRQPIDRLAEIFGETKREVSKELGGLAEESSIPFESSVDEDFVNPFSRENE